MGSRRRELRLPLALGIASLLLAAGLSLAGVRGAAAQTGPAGEATMAWHVTIAPSWFDPSTAPPQITPFGILYALHDGLVRPLPCTARSRTSRPRR